MTQVPKTARSFGGHGLQLGALALLFLLLLGVRQLGLDPTANLIVAIGTLLLSGMLVGELASAVGLPQLTGYIASGVLVGPHVSGVIGADIASHLQGVNTLALALIALAGGLELRLNDLRAGLRGILTATVTQSTLLLAGGTALLFFLRPFIGFARDMPTTMWLGVSLIWGVITVSRSPSITLALISQLKPRGPLTRFALGFVMASDVVVVVLMATVMALVRPWLEPGTEISQELLTQAGRGIIGSISIGTTLGLLLVAYLRLIGGQILLLLLVLSFVVTEALHYLHFEPMLTFLCAGFVVQNLSAQGDRLLHSIEETGSIVFVVFFATTGAQLDLPLVATLWGVALALCGGRILVTYGAHRLGSRIAKDEPAIAAWGWAPMVAQAGLSQGLAAVIASQYPSFGVGIYALVVVTVALNAIIGPVVFKFALQRAGEIPAGT